MNRVNIINSEIIDLPIETVMAFLVKTENLIRWTNFFKKVIAKKMHAHLFETRLGRSVTVIKKDNLSNSSVALSIISRFTKSKKKETARLFLTALQKEVCKVKFIIELPKEIASKVRRNLSDNMRNELFQLKKILEAKDE